MSSTTLDVDTVAVSDFVTAAIRRSGLSLRKFASALGTSAARLSSYKTGTTAPSAAFVFRAGRVADGLAAAKLARLPTLADAVEAIDKADARGDFDWTLAILLEIRDRLRGILSSTPEAAAAWDLALRPADHRSAVVLAALIAREFNEAGLTQPAWTTDLRLPKPWTLPSGRLGDDRVREQTPQWLANRNVFIAARDLITV